MAENKKSFILYLDQRGTFEKLDNEQAGKLIKHIYAYVADEDPEGDFVTELAFEGIKTALKRDLKKWEKQQEQRREAGKRSAESRRRNSTTVNDRSISSTVNVNVNDSVSDNVNENKELNKEILLCSLSDENERSLKPHEKICFDFYKLFKDNLHEAGIKKTTTLDKARLGPWSDQIRLMMETDGRTIEEIREVYLYLKKNQFWKKNIQSAKTLREKFEKLYMSAKQDAPKNPNDDEIQNELRAELKKDGLIN